MTDFTIFQDIALFIARFLVGFFFVSYRFRYIWDPSMDPRFCNITRQQKLADKLKHCGWSPKLASAVALGELAAGLGIMFGVLTELSALGLLFILIVATRCTAKEKTMRQNPIDKIDIVNCYLWCPEPVYIVLTIVVLAFGGGAISIDHLASLILF